MHRGPDFDVRGWHPERPPVVLLGGLNVARALGLSDIPVIVANADPECRAFGSRFCSAAILLPPLERLDLVVQQLVQLGERLRAALGRPVPLFYGNDDYLSLILQNRGRLAPYFRYIVNDPEVSAALIEKERFNAFARSRGLPAPRVLRWEELPAAPGPVLVKPKLKIAWENTQIYLRLFGGAGKARVFEHARDLLSDALVCALREELLFQEYVPGDDRNLWSFHGFADENANVLAWFTGRKIRTYPALTGESSYLELAHHDELAAIGHRVVASAPLKGPFKIDFKYDARGAAWQMLEVNARFNLWHYLGARNGVNIPRAAYEYLLSGRRGPAPASFATTWRWLNLRRDWHAYRDLAARGEIGFWGWLASLAAGRKVYDVFAWTDPVPFIVDSLRRLRRLPRFTVRLTRWLFTAS